jgi:hypothetical protein
VKKFELTKFFDEFGIPSSENLKPDPEAIKVGFLNQDLPLWWDVK